MICGPLAKLRLINLKTWPPFLMKNEKWCGPLAKLRLINLKTWPTEKNRLPALCKLRVGLAKVLVS
jgi:hypothetical protein